MNIIFWNYIHKVENESDNCCVNYKKLYINGVFKDYKAFLSRRCRPRQDHWRVFFSKRCFSLESFRISPNRPRRTWRINWKKFWISQKADFNQLSISRKSDGPRVVGENPWKVTRKHCPKNFTNKWENQAAVICLF